MIKIKESELHISFIRSRGPGGQNVNKVSTAVQLRYNIVNADIPEDIKNRFYDKYRNKISKNGDVIIVAQSHRTQNRNKMDAINIKHFSFNNRLNRNKKRPLQISF